MLKKQSASNVETYERRKHWSDRRSNIDRRNPFRLYSAGNDCRDGVPRRSSDITGELSDGEIWWNKDAVERD